MQKNEINKLKKEIENILSDNKAVEIASINLKGKTSIADLGTQTISAGTTCASAASDTSNPTAAEVDTAIASQLVQKAKQNNWRTLDVFRLMDKNASGRATAGEIAQGLVILGVKNSSLNDAKHFLAFVSPNSEVMEFNELSRALKQTARGHARLGSRGKRKRQ